MELPDWNLVSPLWLEVLSRIQNGSTSKDLTPPALRMVRDLPGVKGVPMPSYVEPCLATLTERPPAGERWVHEIKFDCYRLQLHVAGGQVSCFTRRGYDWAKRFPTIVAAAARLELDAAIIDGEAVMVTPKGDTDFAALESYVSSRQPTRSKHQVVFYCLRPALSALARSAGCSTDRTQASGSRSASCRVSTRPAARQSLVGSPRRTKTPSYRRAHGQRKSCRFYPRESDGCAGKGKPRQPPWAGDGVLGGVGNTVRVTRAHPQACLATEDANLA
jgi:hypothetical protein